MRPTIRLHASSAVLIKQPILLHMYSIHLFLAQPTQFTLLLVLALSVLHPARLLPVPVSHLNLFGHYDEYANGLCNNSVRKCLCLVMQEKLKVKTVDQCINLT